MIDAGTAEPVWRDTRVRRGMATQWRSLTATGVEPRGWKLGLGTAAAMQTAATSGPLLGYLTEQTRLDDDAVVELAGWRKPALEPELAIFLGSDLPGGADRERAAAAVSGLGLAFEAVDLDLPLDRVEAVLAGNIFHRFYMLGPRIASRAGGDTEGIEISICKGPEVLAAIADPEVAVGNLLDLTLHAADYLAEFGGRLKAGHFIIGGSVVPPLLPEPGDSFTLNAGDLGGLRISFA